MSRTPKPKWSPKEEQLLYSLISLRPEYTWDSIAELFNADTPAHCHRTTESIKRKGLRYQSSNMSTLPSIDIEQQPHHGDWDFMYQQASTEYLHQVLQATVNEKRKLQEDLQTEIMKHTQTASRVIQQQAIHQNESDRYRQMFLETRAALTSAQSEVEVLQYQHERLSKDLEYSRSKLYLVDQMVDIRLLEEEGAKPIQDRVGQITDVILGLEKKMEERYLVRLQEKDNQISVLTQALAAKQDDEYDGDEDNEYEEDDEGEYGQEDEPQSYEPLYDSDFYAV